jgi:hypothetical protein
MAGEFGTSTVKGGEATMRGSMRAGLVAMVDCALYDLIFSQNPATTSFQFI